MLTIREDKSNSFRGQDKSNAFRHEPELEHKHDSLNDGKIEPRWNKLSTLSIDTGATVLLSPIVAEPTPSAHSPVELSPIDPDPSPQNVSKKSRRCSVPNLSGTQHNIMKKKKRRSQSYQKPESCRFDQDRNSLIRRSRTCNEVDVPDKSPGLGLFLCTKSMMQQSVPINDQSESLVITTSLTNVDDNDDEEVASEFIKQGNTPRHSNGKTFDYENVSGHKKKPISSKKKHKLLDECKNIIYNHWKRIIVSLILFVLFILSQVRFIDDWISIGLRYQFWLFWISTIILLRVLLQIITIFIIKLIKKISKNPWIMLYTDDLDTILSRTLLAFYANSTFYLSKDYYDIDEFDENDLLSIIIKFLRCINIYFFAVLFKTIVIKYLAIENYFIKYDGKIKQIQKYSSWFKALMGKKRIFTKKPLEFLHCINHLNNDYYKPNMDNQREIEFHITAFEDEEDFDKKYLENGLLIMDTKLWSYNKKWNKTDVISNQELTKTCKIFAKFLVDKVIKTVEKHNDLLKDQALAEKANSMVDRVIGNLKLLNRNSSHKDKNNSNNPEKIVLKAISPYSRRSHCGVYLEQGDFEIIFGNNKKMAQRAFHAMDCQRMGQITTKSLQRKLFKFLKELVNLKQTFDSYHGIIKNLDHVAGIMLIFILTFVFMLIFDFQFGESLSMYVSLLAVISVFGRNAFTSLFDSITFVFFIAPYSIGDACKIKGQWHVIKSIDLLTTTTLNFWENITVFNNAQLYNSSNGGELLQNLTRSTSCLHEFNVYISQDTTTEQIEELKTRFTTFLNTEMANEVGDLWFTCHGVDELCRMHLYIWIGSFISWADARQRFEQEHKIQTNLRRIILEMGIQYHIRYKLFSQEGQLNIAGHPHPSHNIDNINHL